jgi:hypothetical protein
MSAHAVLTGPGRVESPRQGEVSRLLVCWQHPEQRSYHAVGLLSAERGGYAFVYFRKATNIDGFRPLLGFSDATRRYWSPHLFPLFSERVMDASRPDRPRWLSTLDLGADAEPMEVLARSGGHRLGDNIEVLPVPAVADDGQTHCTFLVHGVRHIGDGASERIARLAAGDNLRLVHESDNKVNPRAVLVSDLDGQRLGWVPNPLLDYVHAVRDQGEPTVSVVRANGPEAGPHLRLLVRLAEVVPVGYVPFAGADWETAA